MSSSRAGPVPSRIGVRSMITVTYLSPRRVCRHTCSSTPITATPSKRPGSSIRTRRPSARTASLAVSHATASPSATRATVRCWTPAPRSAHRSPARESFARGGAALVVSCRHTCPHPEHRYRRTVTSSVVGRHPNGSCASRRTHSVPRHALLPAATAPVIRLQDPAGQHRPVRLQPLAGHLQAELVETAERRQVRGREGSVRHVEVFRMGRENFHPRKASTSNPAPTRPHRAYTLDWDEPPK